VRSCQKLSLYPVDPIPASSKMGLPLAKAEPIRDGGRASVIIYLRRGKKTLQQDKGVRLCERNNSADTKVSEEGVGGSAPGTDSVGKERRAFSILCTVSRSHNNDPRGSTKNKALLGIQQNYRRW